MWKWLRKLFKPTVVYKLVEVPSLRTPLQEGPEILESVTTLNAHPGFLYLMQRLSLQNAAIKTQLSFVQPKDMRQVDFLQAGIYWSNWLQMEMDRATKRPSRNVKDVMQEELDAFREIDSQIERVGM